MTVPYVRKHRYATVSVRPETHAALVALLRPRETLDALVLRLIETQYAWGQSRSLEH